ncbi:late embryogenesis abundant protein D-34-like [Vicia villosa]|uniref:late embryogenesis abundant protein D-34-like n=1 Tax=Vicia villosa TaxID=3911 RepID=UPI00273ABBC4|nr:late embryogenesis abundant protein D-34-like [Vicia villosa]
MSQEKPRKEEGIKYEDVFNVQGDTGRKTVAPKDAAMMQKAETQMLGKTQKGGAAATMQSAASKNERDGVVGHDDMSKVAADGGVSITETNVKGRHVISESIGGQVVEQFSHQNPALNTMTPASLVEEMGVGAAGGGSTGGITIGEALEATVLTAGKKPVEWSDAAAIQAAEVRATGRTNIVPGGVAAAAQSAATLNARTTKDENKTKLADVLTDATSKLPADRPATRRDAEGVTGAEMRNDPSLTTHPGGVSASVAAAARLNQNNIN